MQIELPDDLVYLSELYSKDADEAVLLTEYPSSNSDETVFQNKTRYIIHDPFPPPPRELLTSLGPHHLMCCWGDRVSVTSQIAPPKILLDHWQRIFGDAGRPLWKEYAASDRFITLFPHESIPAAQQVVDPEVNYRLHSKEIIEQIDCPQADVLGEVIFPCIVKLSHGYAGLGNFVLRNDEDLEAMETELDQHWPDATIVINSIIENIVGDYGVQFYVHTDGSLVWLGLTEQKFNENSRWCGGTFSADLQHSLVEPFREIVEATASRVHQLGYFGVVGVDILRDKDGSCFLVDVNPRLTGITPFLMASRIFQKERSFDEGIYVASFRFAGTLEDLIHRAEAFEDCQVLVLSAFEDAAAAKTTCHISVSSRSQSRNREVLDQLTAT